MKVNYISFIHYIASYDDLCYEVCAQNIKCVNKLNEFGQEHFKTKGCMEIQNGIRKLNYFDTYNYFANPGCLEFVPDYWDFTKDDLNHELVCYAWITIGFPNKFVLQVVLNAKEVVYKAKDDYTRIVLYSGNFGNYRNELKNGIDYINTNPDIDYYFFTDQNIKSNKWKVIHTNTLSDDAIMNKYRWTNKYYKFVLPNVLKPYHVIIWIDSKQDRLKQLSNLSRTKILNLLKSKKSLLYLRPHPVRKTPQQEIKLTVNVKLENNKAKLFYEKIKNIDYGLKLPELCLFMRINEQITNKMLAHVFTLHKTLGIKRDQNIFNHAVYEKKYPHDILSFFNYKNISV